MWQKLIQRPNDQTHYLFNSLAPRLAFNERQTATWKLGDLLKLVCSNKPKHFLITTRKKGKKHIMLTTCSYSVPLSVKKCISMSIRQLFFHGGRLPGRQTCRIVFASQGRAGLFWNCSQKVGVSKMFRTNSQVSWCSKGNVNSSNRSYQRF